MQKIIFLKGLPGSGKSTWAKQYCKDNQEFRRFNKDDIREEFGNPKFSNSFEKVLLLEKVRAISSLIEGYSIIIDDTNFHEKHKKYWMKISNFTLLSELENELIELENALNTSTI